MSNIDDSRHPFKRTSGIGPGPKKRPRLTQAKDWECVKGKATPSHYVQKCVYVGPNRDKRGQKLTVKTKKSVKKAYNKLYRKWAAKSPRIQKLTRKGAKAGYRCRKTALTRCR